MLKKTIAMVLSVLSVSLLLAACERGPAEKAGRKLDRAGEDVRRGAEDLGDKIQHPDRR